MLPPKSPGAVEGEGTASSPEMEAEFLAALLSGDVLDRPMHHRALSSLPEAGVDGDVGVSLTCSQLWDTLSASWFGDRSRKI